MSGGSKMKEVLFDLTNDALYVTNGGRSFTRKGVIGICASHLSEKRPTDSNSDDYQTEDTDLISKIRKREIKTYENDRNRLTSDFHAEQETSHDYGGRFVWELLQNADDVMGPERQPTDLIGTKGLGFKSVLEITEKPEIHSGPFHFRFSPDETQRLLKDQDIHENPPRLTFRLPHDCPPNDKACGLLEAGYSTVIRLPFRDEEAREKAKSILETLEPCFLFLSQELESVRIILDGEERGFSVERKMQGFSDGRMVLHSPEGKTDWQRWTGTKDNDNAKRLTVAIVLPLDEKGKVVPHADEMPLHVFFPTEEQLGVKALLHASFDLQQNRKRLREGNYDTELPDLLGTVLGKVILDIPARTALKTFGSISEEDGSGPLERIKKTIREKMRTTPFVPVIGGRKVSPPEGQLWEDKLGNVLRTNDQAVKDANLVTPELSDLSNILKKLGATEIEYSEYVQLLRYCRNESLEDCIASFQVLMEGGLKRIPLGREREQTLNLLREVPCWWTDNEQARSLEDGASLLWDKPKDWPKWLAADSLHSESRKKIEEWEKQREENDGLNQPWKNLTNNFLLRREEHYLDRVLIPVVEKWTLQEWKQQGSYALELLACWESQHEFDQTEPCVKGEEGRQNTLSTVLRLPTEKGWLPAINCFAGKSWDGPEAFDEFFKDREGSGIVQAFEEWPNSLREISRDRWKELLRWIGVSWEPKVCQKQDFRISHRLWTAYHSGRRDRPRPRPGGKNYLIRDFPDCLSKIGKRNTLQSLPTLIKLSSKRAERRWSYRTGYNVYGDSEQSFAREQLHHEAWLPVKKSLLEDREHIPPNEAFLPNKGLSGLLPEVDRSGIDNTLWYGDIEPKLRELGVMDSLPDDAEKWHEWMRRLAEKGGNLSEEAPPNWKDGEKLWRAARSLYSEYLKREISGLFPDDVKIPCVCLENRQRSLHFSPPKKVYWIDAPYLTDSTLETALLNRGYKLFIFRLKDGDKSADLGIQKLSDAIECHPRFNDFNHTETERLLSQRYEKRRIALEKVKNIKLPEAVDIKAVINLSLELSVNEQNLGRCSVHSWKEEGTNPILVNIESEGKKWRALADALAHRLHNDERYAAYANDFEVYLADDDDESVLERARNAGVPEEALEEVENSFQQSMPNGQLEEGTESESKDFPPERSNTPSAAPNASDLAHQIPKGVEDTEQQTANHDGYEAAQPAPGDGSGSIQSTDKNELSASQNVSQSNSGNGQSRAGRQRLNGETRPSYPRPESGSEAQQWLGLRLHEQWPDVDPDPRGKIGRDFTLSVGGRAVHIEAKHVENPPGAIHWSDRQYELAEETSRNEDVYFIAVLSPDRDGENEYRLHWIWDPLEHMKDMDRNVTWSGKSEPEQLQTGDWNMADTKPPNVSPEKYEIEVKLTNDIFNEENQDGPQLERLQARIESLNGVAEQETAEAQLG